MATKFYLHDEAPAYSPASFRGAWDDTAGAVTKLLDTVAGGYDDVITSVARAEADAADEYDVLLFRGVSGPLAAQNISGTVNLIVGVQESSTSMNAHFHVHIYVTQGDSDTPRGTLLSDYREAAGVNEWPTFAAGRGLNAAQALSALDVSAGDRIVVEIGYTARNTSTTSYTGTLWYGAPVAAMDLPDSGDETTLPGTITFSDDITFITDDATSVTRQVVRTLSGMASSEMSVTRLAVRTLSPAWNSPMVITRVAVRTLSQIPPAGGVPIFDQYYRRMRQ